MSIQAVAWALEQEDVPARPKLVLVSICNHARHTDGYCWLNVETIAHEAACSRRAVFNFVGDLIRNGFVRKAVRRGDDGKQRANDYWVLLDRADMPWIKAQQGDEEAAEEAHDNDAAPPDVVDRVHTVHAADDGENLSTEAPEIPAGAPGPHAHGCTPLESAEPSKTNPKASSARATPVIEAATRGYKPPPPQPMGADLATPSKPIFVYVGTPAYRAWAIRKSLENRLGLKANGDPKWHCESKQLIEGKWCTGWYFPTLFPRPQSGTPEEGKPSTGPPASSAA
jgi:hypothetical protein